MIGAGLLTVLLYAPVLGAMTHTLAGPKATGGAPQWKSLGWFVSETARGLARGVPGGWITLVVMIAVVAIGLWSYWRASVTATLLLIMPGLVTAVVMLVTAHNLWPRLFFFALGFAALIAVRGGFELCRLAFKERGEMVATAGAVLAFALSLFMVPRVWAPKQDFGAAMDWVAQANTKGELVVTVDMTRLPYRDYYRTWFLPAGSAADLAQAEQATGHALVLVTFPERLQAVDTAIWNRLQCCYQEVKRFGGTVEGGAITVMRSR
jgi:hypothetical protein